MACYHTISVMIHGQQVSASLQDGIVMAGQLKSSPCAPWVCAANE